MACLLLSTTACGEESGEGPKSDAGGRNKGSGSCALQFTYEGRTYKDVANLRFTATTRLGDATRSPCNDTGEEPDSGEQLKKESAYKISGVSPRVAIAVGDNAKTAKLFAVYSGSKLPEEVKELR
ncbi:DUF6281 family protein [Streptomyces longisporoflavus]|uniref:DUF6281 family protein n=1 Tax=Streptomyces longisporoflavus TaxID=28044 RepID=UPI00167CB34E|nr:DUF6281 family protein [Streptomyces longisporoflavus]